MKTDIWMPFYISDYLSDTMHLTTQEHGAYLLMILHYWKTGPLPDDDARLATITRLGDAWSNASSILRAFFKHQDGMLRHTRIDAELVNAAANKQRNHNRAALAAAKRWEKEHKDATSNAPSNATSNARTMLDECSSPSPSPIHKKNTSAVAPPDGVSDSVWQSFVKARKARRATITDVVIEGIKREADKAGWTLENAIRECVERGWQSFKAEWVAKPADVARVTAPGPKGPDPELQRMIEQRAMAAKPPPEVMAKIREWTGR